MNPLFKLDLDEALIDSLAEKIAERAAEIISNKSIAPLETISNQNEKTISQLPPILTRTEAMEILRCSTTKIAELMARPDFPVFREAGVKIPTHMLIKWIENNTQWVDEHTNFYNQEAM